MADTFDDLTLKSNVYILTDLKNGKMSFYVGRISSLSQSKIACSWGTGSGGEFGRSGNNTKLTNGASILFADVTDMEKEMAELMKNAKESFDNFKKFVATECIKELKR